MSEGRLFIVGTGLQLGHMTSESKNAIRRAKKVLYLIPDPITISEIQELNDTAESLSSFYAEGKERIIIYNEIIDYIITSLQQFKDLCVAFYGHPGVYTYPSHKAINKAKKLNYEAKMLPAISTEDCLFADLGIDPGDSGSQSFEATDFLSSKKHFDPRCIIILWQIGILGFTTYQEKPVITNFLTELKHHLLNHYESEQEIIFYEASSHRILEPIITRSQLSSLDRTNFTSISTLIIPPRNQKD